jgi:hypothetical protein
MQDIGVAGFASGGKETHSQPPGLGQSLERPLWVRSGGLTASADGPLSLPLRASCCIAANRRWVPKADMAILRGTPQGGAKLVSRSLAISAPADTKQPPQLGNRRSTFPRRRAVNQIANSDRDVREVVAAWIKLS